MTPRRTLLAILIGAFAFGGAAQAQAACDEVYTVRPGDWLSRIAERCDVPMETIRALNPGIDPNLIERGQPIRLRPAPEIDPVFDLQRVPVAAMPPSPPQMGPVRFTGEVVREAGACLIVRDAAGRLYSFARSAREVTAGMKVSVSGEVVGNWFCESGAEVLVDSLAAEPEQIAALDAAL